ncbi:uncharacterized protein Bfra_005100 [Botrytis fragariae]|uniref:Uncharacterized protein n=1 Tax=Botrytis fragariae TaxID=1964551 RepID=A0A8H6AU45_9HELO|nr:uncharacterized protein Bfra_005100 [Botrytis fragariae]KAF5873636.1 hypothetical protein Bfra_005100 [Botrytis fragariae]
MYRQGEKNSSNLGGKQRHQECGFGRKILTTDKEGRDTFEYCSVGNDKPASLFDHTVVILKLRPTSFVRPNCLRNAPAFDDVESFLAEYQFITVTKMAQQLTSVTALSRGEEPWPMANYIDCEFLKPFFLEFGS